MNHDPNLAILEMAVDALGPLLDELVLVGGCAIGLLITDRARPPVRQTVDVDLLTEVAPRTDYYALCERLKERGFKEHTGEVMCRWSKEDLLVDIMPTDESILGFTNPWYARAVAHADRHRLSGGQEIRLINAVYFLATKVEAFHDRGGGDYLHHDIEDIVTLVDGRESIVDEVLAADDEVRDFLREEFDNLLADPVFTDRMSWHLAPNDQRGRKEIILARMRKIAGL